MYLETLDVSVLDFTVHRSTHRKSNCVDLKPLHSLDLSVTLQIGDLTGIRNLETLNVAVKRFTVHRSAWRKSNGVDIQTFPFTGSKRFSVSVTGLTF